MSDALVAAEIDEFIGSSEANDGGTVLTHEMPSGEAGCVVRHAVAAGAVLALSLAGVALTAITIWPSPREGTGHDLAAVAPAQAAAMPLPPALPVASEESGVAPDTVAAVETRPGVAEAKVAEANAAPSTENVAAAPVRAGSSGFIGTVRDERGGRRDAASAFISSPVAIRLGANAKGSMDLAAVRDFESDDGLPCREYRQTVTIERKRLSAAGTVCRRRSGRWVLVR